MYRVFKCRFSRIRENIMYTYMSNCVCVCVGMFACVILVDMRVDLFKANFIQNSSSGVSLAVNAQK